MITWQEVVGVSAISGTAVGYSYGATDTVENQGRTTVQTYDWFGGEIAGGSSFNRTDFGYLNEDFANVEVSIDGTNETYFYTYDWGKNYTYRNGSATYTFFTMGRTDAYGEGEGFFESIGDIDEIVSVEPFNSNWSRSSANLPSYELTTLQNQTGRTTVTTDTQQQIRTTQLVDDIVETVLQNQNTTRTTTSQINTSTVATWQVKTYDTVFLTGQTTANLFSSFSHDLPAVWQSAVSSTSKVIEPLSFVSVGTYAGTQNFTIKGTSGTFSLHASTATTAGAVVSNSTNPQTAVGGTKATTVGDAFVSFRGTEQQDADEQFATVSFNAGIATSKALNFLGNTVAAPFVSTSSLGRTSEGYTTQSTDSNGGTTTQSGSFILSTINHFTTERAAAIVGVAEATVGVRAISNGAAGDGIEAGGQGNAHYRHTSSVLLPASTTRESGTRSTTWSLNSYTVRNSSNGETQSEYSATGAAQSQYMTVATTESNAARATVLGGVIRGEALIYNGAYSTLAQAGEGTTEVTEPFGVTWAAGAATSAWIPSLRAMTVDAAEAVVAISRHSFTQVLDD
jgi:hypothetical protein